MRVNLAEEVSPGAARGLPAGSAVRPGAATLPAAGG